MDPTDEDALAEQIARVLLDRYGVLFRDVTTREPMTIPWRLVMKALRRLEARGVVRGGRFVMGVAGEQFAHPEAIPLLRAIRNEPLDGIPVTVASTDPANLTGLLFGNRVPAQRGRAVTFIDGLPAEIATPVGAR